MDVKTIIEAVKTLGWTKGVFALFFFLAHYWVFRLYSHNMNDKQQQVDRIAEENHEYREYFFKIVVHGLDKAYGYTVQKPED